jgi:FkbM family methyltransferase
VAMSGLSRGVRSTIRRLIDRVTLRGDLLAALDRVRGELALGEPARLAADLAALREDYDRLAADYDRLQRRVRFNSRIDVLDTGADKIMIFKDDFGYRFTPEGSRNYRLTVKDYVPPDRTEQPVDPTVLFRREPYLANASSLILTHAWANGLTMSMIDIGASYGLESIAAARFVRRCGRTMRIVGFEPGIAGQLTELNVRLNHVADMVTIVRAAVGNFNGPMLLTGELGHTEHNRLVNPVEDQEVVCFPVEVVTLDRYLSEHGIDGPLVVKIDTEGAEPEVLDGMRRTLAERVVVLFVEYSPDSISDRVAPAAFLQRLAELGTVIDLNQGGPTAKVGDGLRPVPPREFAAFAEEVRHRSCGWSDVLVLPYNLPDRETLLATLCKRPLSQVA